MHARPTIVSTFVAPKLLICGENIFYASWLTMRESRILRESKPIFSSVKNHFLNSLQGWGYFLAIIFFYK